MAIIIKKEDILDINNNLNLNNKIFYIEKIKKVILKGFDNIGNNSLVQSITINNMFNPKNIINTLHFYIQSSMYFTLNEVLYANINNTSISGSFANTIYTNNDNTIYVNMPFYYNNCYYIQSIPTYQEVLKNAKHVNNFLNIIAVLNTYNTGLLKIINLTKIIKSSFFLYEYMMTEVILFPYTNIKNLYFKNIIDFINYMQTLNIHIENANLYKDLYYMNTYDVYDYLIAYFNVNNNSFNLPDNIDIEHHNFWCEYAIINNKNNIPNCEFYSICANQYEVPLSLKTYHIIKTPVYNINYTKYINQMLNNQHTLLNIINNHILTSWQYDNLHKILPKITYINNKIYMNNKSCYLTISSVYESNNSIYIYNLDNGSITINSY